VRGPGLTSVQRDRLLKFLRLLSSDQLGERAAAGLHAHTFAMSLGGWDKIFGDVTAEGDLDLWLRANAAHIGLSDWDRRFVASIGPKIRSGLQITERQRQQLHRIALEAEESAA